MNMIVKSAAVVAALLLASTSAQADVTKGQKIYQKKFTKLCGQSGAKFAAAHTQSEWEDAKDEGKLADVFSTICPAGEKIFKGTDFKEKMEADLYDFVHEYASDSGNVPSC